MSTYYRTSPIGRLHKTPECLQLARSLNVYKVTVKKVKPSQLCRYCFPDEGMSTKEVHTK